MAHRRGDNWSGPIEGHDQFLASEDDRERCVLCCKLIRDHYGGTEYRCAPHTAEELRVAERNGWL